jgi:hypothetical protein
VPSRQRASEASLRQRVESRRTENQRLREENASLKQELAIAYGQRRAASLASDSRGERGDGGLGEGGLDLPSELVDRGRKPGYALQSSVLAPAGDIRDRFGTDVQSDD